MRAFEMIVTDVTCYGSRYCVAGWDRLSKRMIRPEPSSANVIVEASRFWESNLAGPGRPFAVGNIVKFEAAKPPAEFPFPHASEDVIVAARTIPKIEGYLSLGDVASAVAAGVAPTLKSAFGDALVRADSGKAYIPSGHVGRSLIGLEKAPKEIKFYENNYDPDKIQLRATVFDGGTSYDMSVTAEAARTRWKTGKIAGLDADLEASKRVHMRVGLARPFPAKPNECFLQVNGLYFL
jgi:hypothetical protein